MLSEIVAFHVLSPLSSSLYACQVRLLASIGSLLVASCHVEIPDDSLSYLASLLKVNPLTCIADCTTHSPLAGEIPFRGRSINSLSLEVNLLL